MISIQHKSDRLEKYRYELKIPLDQVQFIEFRNCLTQLGLYPQKTFPGRRINSVYFDTHDLNDYVDNISGIADRCKTRLRWYNNDITRLTLELKIKKNKASYKESLKLKNSSKHNPSTMKDIQKIMQDHKSSAEYVILQNVSPVLEVQYDRQYFLLSQDLRMTIDLNQKFRRLYPSPSKSFIKSPVYSVAEFKFPADKRNSMQSLMRNIPFRLFRHSKYVIGMDTVAL